MSGGAAAAGAPERLPRVLRPALLGVAVAVLAFGVLFRAEAQAAVAVWMVSTAFGHCFLVLPIALFLGWERREAFAALLREGARPRAQFVPLVALLPLVAAWLIAERLGIMEGRQLVALAMLELVIYALLGPVLWRCMAVPLLYLVFLVPFGGFLTPVLQDFTARFIDLGLDVLGIPHIVSHTIIEIPAGSFLVAEACAGLRFLIASIAFGVLYACTIYRSAGRRIAFIAASIVVPILANGLRALGIVVLGDVLGNAQAAAVDHIVYGWLFFTVVTAALILGGLPFREDRLPVGVAPARLGDRGGAAVWVVAAIGIALAAMGPATAAWLDRRVGGDAVSARFPLVMPAGCTLGAGMPGEQVVTCGDTHLVVRALLFGPGASPQMLIAARGVLAGPGETVASVAVPAGAHRSWQLVRTADPARTYAIGLWATADGSEAAGVAWRLRQALASSLGRKSSGWRPILGSVAVQDAVAPADAEAVLRAFLAAQPDAPAGIEALAPGADG